MKKIALFLSVVMIFLLSVTAFATGAKTNSDSLANEISSLEEALAKKAEEEATEEMVVGIPEGVYNFGRTATIKLNLGKKFAGTKITLTTDAGTDPTTYTCNSEGVVEIITDDLSTEKFLITAVDSINEDIQREKETEVSTTEQNITNTEVSEPETTEDGEGTEKGEKKSVTTTYIILIVGVVVCVGYLVADKVLKKKKQKPDNYEDDYDDFDDEE